MQLPSTQPTASDSPLQNPVRRIAAFFYGSFMRRDVMALSGFYPDRIEVAKLSGHDITFDPHANVFRADSRAIYGILVYTSHEELGKLYSRDGVGVFLPEAVVVETTNIRLLPAMCYMPPARGTKPPDPLYVERILEAARQHGFPTWYVNHLESFRLQHDIQRLI
jgi:AIG2-like family